MRLAILGLGAALALSAPATATTYLVRPDGLGDFPFIQDAINAAVNGDVIELADGIFDGPRNWNLDYHGKAITIRSQSGNCEHCIIDCWNQARGAIFMGGEGPQSRLEGVTITDGYSPSSQGGGCVIAGTSPTFSGCEFSYCRASSGGAVYCAHGSPTFANCIFRSNVVSSETSGGGIVIADDCEVAINDCIFAGNYAGQGGGALVTNATAVFSNCTFSGNQCVDIGAGVNVNSLGHAVLVDCTLFGNEATGQVSTIFGGEVSLQNTIIAFATRGPAVHCQDGGTAALECCDLYGNLGGDWVGSIASQQGVNGNISLDPQFCDGSVGDFTLEADSPCGPDFNPDCGLIGAFGIGCADAASVPEPPEDEPPAAAITWGGLKALFRQ